MNELYSTDPLPGISSRDRRTGWQQLLLNIGLVVFWVTVYLAGFGAF